MKDLWHALSSSCALSCGLRFLLLAMFSALCFGTAARSFPAAAAAFGVEVEGAAAASSVAAAAAERRHFLAVHV